MSENSNVAPSIEITSVGIVGSGIMGSGLVEVAAKAGYQVIARSRSASGAQGILDGLAKSLAKQVDRGKLEAEARDAVLARVEVTDDLARLADCDLVIESVVEDLAVKQELFAELDRVVKPGAILATNTSTLPVVEIAMATARPELVCGIHFFNPAPMMALVEVVRPITASDATIAAAIEVADRAGFVVNALLFPYLNNAIAMLERGTASRDDIDTAMKGGCNFPMGPFALLDLVGLDTSLAILDALYAEFRDPNYAPAPMLRRLVAAGKLGRKSGSGFYDY